jgi:hypothetical protein
MPYIGNTTSSFNVDTNNINNGAVTTEKLAAPIAPTVSSINGGPLAGMRNAIINGNFDVWQRGTSTGTWVAPVSNYYWPDRWVLNSSGTGGNGSVSQQAFTAGQTDVPGEPTYFMRWQITSAASGQTGGNNWVEQRIEDVRTLAGQAATISFYAKGTGTLPNIYLTQTFGSGGSAQVLYTLASSVTLSASWTKYTYTVNVGSISGKTIGTNHYVGLTFMVPLNATYTFDLAQVQIEPGTVATPFERRSYGQELALCQRYYEIAYQPTTGNGYGFFSSLYTTTNSESSHTWYFAVPKRATPTFTLLSTTGWQVGTPSINPTQSSILFYRLGNFYTLGTGGAVAGAASAEL